MKPSAHPTIIKAVIILGYVSVLSFGLSVALGVLVEAIGINSMFLQVAMPISLITLVLGWSLLRQSMSDKDRMKVRLATRLAFLSLVFLVFFFIFFAFFFTWIFSGAYSFQKRDFFIDKGSVLL